MVRGWQEGLVLGLVVVRTEEKESEMKRGRERLGLVERWEKGLLKVVQ